VTDPIYHLTPESELRAGISGEVYTPARFAEDGFVHCAAEPDTVLAVARDYFPNLDEALLVLEVDPDRLTARFVFEAAAPIEGGGTEHLEGATEFPHVYGPLDRAAIRGVAKLGRGGDYRWPQSFAPIDAFA
jgi:hypothetical protein